MSRRNVLCLVLAALVASTAAPADAAAYDPVVMTASGGTQKHHPTTYTHTKQTSRTTCATLISDGPRTRLPAVEHDGSSLSWRIDDRRRPVAVSLGLTRYLLRTDVGLSVGERSEELDFTLHAIRSRGRVVAWRVVSEPVGEGDMDLFLGVRWNGECDSEDSAYYAFRAMTPLL